MFWTIVFDYKIFEGLECFILAKTYYDQSFYGPTIFEANKCFVLNFFGLKTSLGSSISWDKPSLNLECGTPSPAVFFLNFLG